MDHSGDEVRPVTALFVDVVGSTSLGERLQPEEVKVLIGDCVSRMSRAVEEHGGTVQAYAGDGIAAYFGVPAARDDDAERAALAALAILREMEAYADEVASAWGVADFRVRVGINSGHAGVGAVGAANPQMVALGDMTNVAARLQAAAEPGSIAVGERTERQLRNRFVLEPLGDLTVKGRAAPVSAWRLVRRKAARRQTSRVPLVGRSAEIARLQKVVAELQAGRGMVLSIRGDAGIGKSCLLGEVGDLVSRDVVWHGGRCRAFSPLYWPFLEMLRSWLEVDEAQAEILVRTRLRARLLETVGGDRIDAVMPYLGHLLGTKQSAPHAAMIHDLRPAELGERVRAAFREWIECEARTRPVVVAIEDMHVADPATCHTAESLLSLTDEAPLLLAFTMRTEPDSTGWAFHVNALASHPHRVVDLPVEPLEEAESEELAEALGVSDAAVRRIIATRAEGNPLYVEELSSLPASDEQPRSRTWTISIRRVDLPSALDTLLIAELDSLSDDARAVVQAAAVIGRVFRASVLQSITGADALRSVPELLRRGIIRERRRQPDLEYSFRHGLLQEAALSTLTPARREALYRAGAAAVESLYAGDLDTHAEMLAHYHAQAGDPGAALRYLEMAAERAESLGEASHTLQLWTRVRRAASAIGDAAAETRADERIATLQDDDAAVTPAGTDEVVEAAPTQAPRPVAEPQAPRPVDEPPADMPGGYRTAETILERGPLRMSRATAADGTPVILHVIEQGADDEVTGRRLLERARTAQGLEDRHVVPILEASAVDGRLVIATAAMAGGSLDGRLAKGPLTLAQTTWTIAHVAVGLDVAHAAGIVHGALSPAAILFDDERAAVTWIVDPEATDEAYLAPEVRAGAAPDAPADVYSLASIAAACLTGAAPPGGDVEIPADLPVAPGVAWAIGLGRAPDPSGRPPTAMMFAQMLKRAGTIVHA